LVRRINEEKMSPAKLLEKVRPEVLLLAFLPPNWAFPAYVLWEFIVIKRYNEIVPPYGDLILYHDIHPGWFLYAYCDADSPDLRLRMEFTAVPTPLEVDTSYRELYEAGYLRPMDKFLWLPRYDDTAKKYVAAWTPSGLGLPFRDEIRAWLHNPTGTDIKVRLAVTLIIKLNIPYTIIAAQKEALKELEECLK